MPKKQQQSNADHERPRQRLPDLTFTQAAVLCLAATIAFVALTVTSLRNKSVTIDEFGHLPAGYNLLATGDFNYCEFNPPLINVLTALPLWLSKDSDGTVAEPPDPQHRYSFWVNGYPFMKLHQGRYHEIFVKARLVTVALAAALGILAFLWGRTLVPTRPNIAGLAAAILILFSPEVLAHGRLVTTDVGSAFFILLSLVTFHGFLRSSGWLRTSSTGIALGLAQLAKFTAVYLYPIYILVAAIHIWKQPRPHRKSLTARALLLLMISLLVLNAGYFFTGTGRTLARHEFQSSRFKSVQASLPGWLPMPLPAQYLRGFDRQLVDSESDEPAFLFGETYTGGRSYYFIALLAIKMPIPVLILAVWSLVVAAWSLFLAVRTGFPPFIRGDKGGLSTTKAAKVPKSTPKQVPSASPPLPADTSTIHLLLLLPAAVILFTFSVLSHHQVGLRLILPAVVLGLIWIVVVLGTKIITRKTTWAAGVLLTWAVIESVWMHPDYLAYFNQFVGGPRQGSRYALDANLDWGQDLPKLNQFMKERGLESIQLLYYGRVEPGVYGINYEVPRQGIHPGFLAVSASLYGRGYLLNDHGSLYPSQPLPQLRTMFGKPVASLGYSIDVYEVPNSSNTDN